LNVEEKALRIKKALFNVQNEMVNDTKAQLNIEKKISSPSSPVPDTPVDDILRRSVKYGLGPTVRFSNEASEIIMGQG
jgi:hypothetical protein